MDALTAKGHKGFGTVRIAFDLAIHPANDMPAEIDVPEQYRNFQRKTGSIADEIKKLKELLDEGALTQEEFDTQKKKLLEKQ